MGNQFLLEGKTILVTGSSSGIGRGVAVECAKMGAKLVLNGRNEERLAQTLIEHAVHQRCRVLDTSVEDRADILLRLAELGITICHELLNVSRAELSEIVRVADHAVDSHLADLRIVDRDALLTEQLVKIAGDLLHDHDESVGRVDHGSEEPVSLRLLGRASESSHDLVVDLHRLEVVPAVRGYPSLKFGSILFNSGEELRHVVEITEIGVDQIDDLVLGEDDTRRCLDRGFHSPAKIINSFAHDNSFQC